MSFQDKQGIVPQLATPSSTGVRGWSALAVPLVSLVLSACSTVQLNVAKPTEPTTLEQAKAYVANRERALEVLEYELNEQSRACYQRFFVSNCLDEVRMNGAELRRAHLEVLGKAEDMIRLNDYTNRRARKSE